MRRILLGGIAAGALLAVAPSIAAAAGPPLYGQCPAVGANTGCQFLVVVSSGGQQLLNDAGQGPYDGSEDSLIGVQNNSSAPISSIPISSPGGDLYGFESDGICNVTPAAPGCVMPPVPPATTNTPCTASTGNSGCAYPPPPGEGPNFKEPGSTVATFPNGDQQSGYEGPTSWFTNVSPDNSSGVVRFDPPIPPGGSTYFSLEQPPAGNIVIGSSTTVSTALTAGSARAASLITGKGTPVSDQATVVGVSGVAPTGSVTYSVFADPACTRGVASGGTTGVGAGGVAGASAPLALGVGTYYWQARYSGDSQNAPAVSACGSEVLTVKLPQALKTLGLKKSRTCKSRRKFKIHVRVPKGLTPASAVVKISKRAAKNVTFPAGRATDINLKGLPKGKFKITILVTTTDGQQFTDVRKYKTCTKKGKKK